MNPIASMNVHLGLEDKMSSALKKAERNVLDAADRITGAIASIHAAVSRPINAVVSVTGIASALSAFSRFDDAMKNVQAVAGYTSSEMEKISDVILELGRNSRYGANLVSEAYYEIVSGVADTSKHFDMLKNAIQLAEAGQSNLIATTQGFIFLMNAYNLEASEAARVSDIFAQTVAMGVGSMDQFVSAMAPIASTMQAGNIALEEFGAAMAFLTSRGVSASEAATRLQSLATAFIAPSEQTKEFIANIKLSKEQLDKLGLTIKEIGEGFEYFDKQGRKVTLTGSALLKGLGLEGATKLLRETAGEELFSKLIARVEARSAAFSLLGSGFDEFRKEYESKIKGATNRALDIQMEAFSYKVDRVKAVFGDLAIKIGASIARPLVNFLTIIAEIVDKLNKINPQILIDFFKNLSFTIPLGMFLGPLGTFIGLLTTLYNLINNLSKSDIGAKLAELFSQIQLPPEIQRVLTGLSSFFSAFFKSIAEGVRPALDLLRERVQNIFNEIKEKGLIGFIVSVFQSLGKLDFSQLVEAIKRFAKLVFETIKIAFASLFGGEGGTENPLNSWLSNVVSSLLENIKKFASFAKEKIEPIIQSIASFFRDIFLTFIRTAGIEKEAKEFIGNAKRVFTAIVERIRDTVSRIRDWIVENGPKIAQALRNFIQDLIASIRNFFSEGGQDMRPGERIGYLLGKAFVVVREKAREIGSSIKGHLRQIAKNIEENWPIFVAAIGNFLKTVFFEVIPAVVKGGARILQEVFTQIWIKTLDLGQYIDQIETIKPIKQLLMFLLEFSSGFFARIAEAFRMISRGGSSLIGITAALIGPIMLIASRLQVFRIAARAVTILEIIGGILQAFGGIQTGNFADIAEGILAIAKAVLGFLIFTNITRIAQLRRTLQFFFQFLGMGITRARGYGGAFLPTQQIAAFTQLISTLMILQGLIQGISGLKELASGNIEAGAKRLGDALRWIFTAAVVWRGLPSIFKIVTELTSALKTLAAAKNYLGMASTIARTFLGLYLVINSVNLVVGAIEQLSQGKLNLQIFADLSQGIMMLTSGLILMRALGKFTWIGVIVTIISALAFAFAKISQIGQGDFAKGLTRILDLLSEIVNHPMFATGAAMIATSISGIFALLGATRKGTGLAASLLNLVATFTLIVNSFNALTKAIKDKRDLSTVLGLLGNLMIVFSAFMAVLSLTLGIGSRIGKIGVIISIAATVFGLIAKLLEKITAAGKNTTAAKYIGRIEKLFEGIARFDKMQLTALSGLLAVPLLLNRVVKLFGAVNVIRFGGVIAALASISLIAKGAIDLAQALETGGDKIKALEGLVQIAAGISGFLVAISAILGISTPLGKFSLLISGITAIVAGIAEIARLGGGDLVKGTIIVVEQIGEFFKKVQASLGLSESSANLVTGSIGVLGLLASGAGLSGVSRITGFILIVNSVVEIIKSLSDVMKATNMQEFSAKLKELGLALGGFFGGIALAVGVGTAFGKVSLILTIISGLVALLSSLAEMGGGDLGRGIGIVISEVGKAISNFSKSVGEFFAQLPTETKTAILAFTGIIASLSLALKNLIGLPISPSTGLLISGFFVTLFSIAEEEDKNRIRQSFVEIIQSIFDALKKFLEGDIKGGLEELGNAITNFFNIFLNLAKEPARLVLEIIGIEDAKNKIEGVSATLEKLKYIVFGGEITRGRLAELMSAPLAEGADPNEIIKFPNLFERIVNAMQDAFNKIVPEDSPLMRFLRGVKDLLVTISGLVGDVIHKFKEFMGIGKPIKGTGNAPAVRPADSGGAAPFYGGGLTPMSGFLMNYGVEGILNTQNRVVDLNQLREERLAELGEKVQAFFGPEGIFATAFTSLLGPDGTLAQIVNSFFGEGGLLATALEQGKGILSTFGQKGEEVAQGFNKSFEPVGKQILKPFIEGIAGIARLLIAAGKGPLGGLAAIGASILSVVLGFENVESRDRGGTGKAGTPYLIGTGAQPELFIPRSSGYFIPNAAPLLAPPRVSQGTGDVYQIHNITVYGVNDPKELFDAIKREARLRNAPIES